MWGNVLRSALLCGVLASGVPSGVAAVDGFDPYTPVTPRESTLAGSVFTTACRSGEPMIVYSLVMTEGSASPPAARTVSDAASAVLTVTGDVSPSSLPLGTMRDGRLDGEVAWPWPETDVTAAAVRAEVRVGETALAVPLDRPQGPGCALPAVGAATLAGTGAEVPLVIASLGGAVLVGGVVVFAIGRRRSRRAAVGR
ncbi:hypothetical protein LQ938_03300 [Microbacterium sp. cx-55]|uniref:hypothetical protein n=1 Tax=Microbacterium sp. cx-55 TaxID=2875948 RepID=UPI001CC04077|nr:hypothetical protein [Microbacterium sp. cx-55]MBZ4486916.1 hypothetical protein [Microbacterium sp. cx-55]UGB35839.1 hypothetical protein LQ938_03300 [Microbacterium sp. cx-55]